MLDRRQLLASGAAAALAPLAGAHAQTLPQAAPPPAYASGEAARLYALMDEWMVRSLRRSPEFATNLGLDRGENAALKTHLSDYSLAQVKRDEAETLRRLQELKALDRAKLSGQPAVHYDTLLFQQEISAQGVRQFDLAAGGVGYPYGFTQLSGSYRNVPDFLDNAHTIETAADAEAYLSRLHEWGGRALDQEVETVNYDFGRGVVPPDFALDKALGQIKALQAHTPETSPLVVSIVRRTKEKNIPGDWGARAGKIWVAEVQPALARQAELMTRMRAGATHEAGIWKIKDGEAFYALSLRAANTTRLSPDEIHRLGLDTLAQLQSQADMLMKRNGYTQGTVGERYRAMYADPKFHYPNTDAGKEKLLADLNRQVQVITAKLPAYFGQLPKTPLLIKRVPPFIEAGAPGGYYNTGSLDGTRPGIYWINLRDTAEVPSWTLPTLTYHEGIPGHHLQLTLQQESQVPLLMKTVGNSAHAEGWGLYAEQLAVEMGMYENDPLGQIGMLHDAAFRAVRLVVDSGMHAKRWSREQAIKFYVDAIGDQEAGAITEIERYSVWPGQATSYMVGKLKILELRDKAKAALGPKFDIRHFHGLVLLNGSVPLEVLERLIDDDVRRLKA
ncbi:MAG TPA: DUF885 family protein [Caulobacteraceae bacterium]|jgi:uncharacterized protein (DUF885 family)